MSAPEVHIYLARSEEDLRAAYPVMVQLRPRFTVESFVEQTRRQARERGYEIALLEHEGTVRAVAGFRVNETLFSGLHLYVDDLVTDDKARSRGLGGLLLEWLASLAQKESCASLELDSGVQRAGAHRFYFRHGMHVSTFRFRRNLSAEQAKD